jgi:hypothetical protein
VVAATRRSLSKQRRKLKIDPVKRAAYLLNSIPVIGIRDFRKWLARIALYDQPQWSSVVGPAFLMALGKISPSITVRGESAVHG